MRTTEVKKHVRKICNVKGAKFLVLKPLTEEQAIGEIKMIGFSNYCKVMIFKSRSPQVAIFKDEEKTNVVISQR